MDDKALTRACSYIKGWLKFNYERDDIPGFVVAISHNGKVIFKEAYGYANLETKQKLTPEHLFRIASHSKTFTATSIMQLHEQGKLKIDDPVVGYLPWLAKHKDKRWKNVTLRQLLCHGAGVIRDGTDTDYWSVYKSFPSEVDFKKDVLAADLVIDNNTKLKYSNYGYALLGMVIAELSGKAYNKCVAENIITPLGLQNTGTEFSESIRSKLVTGYSRLGPDKKRLPIAQLDTRAMSPATGFYSNAADLCAYFNAHMVGSGQLLGDESKKEMQKVHWRADNTTYKREYGLGLEIEYVNKRRLFGHGGGFPGHITKSYFDPKDKLVVIVLTNASGSWAAYMGKSVIKVFDYFQSNAGAPKWKKFEGRYMNLWSDLDVIAAGDILVTAIANDWEPFENPDELEHLKGNTFKISKTDSFNSVDEEVEFKLNSTGQVTAMIHSGGTMLPEAEYLKRMASKKRIG